MDTSGEGKRGDDPAGDRAEGLRAAGVSALERNELAAAEASFSAALLALGDGVSMRTADLFADLAGVWERQGRRPPAEDLSAAADAMRRGLEAQARPGVREFRGLVASLREDPAASEDLGFALYALGHAERFEAFDLTAARAAVEESYAIGLAHDANSDVTLRRGASLVILFVLTGDTDGAIALGDELRGRLRLVAPADAAEVLRSLAQLRLRRGETDAAARDAAEAVEAATVSGSDSRRAAALSVAGLVRWECRELDAAAALYSEALEIFASVGEVSVPVAATLSRLADVELAQGRESAASALLARAADVLRRCAADGEEYAAAEGRLAEHLATQGELTAAAARFRIAVNATAPGAERLRLLLGLGNVKKEMRDFAEAERIFHRVLADAETLGEDALVDAALLSLGGAQRWSGELDAAERTYRRALERATDDLARAQVVANLGGIRHDRCDYAAAVACYREALALCAARGSTMIGTLTLNLATSLHGLGELDAADLAYAEALRSMPGAGRAPVTAAAGRAQIARQQGRIDDAISLYDDAIARAEAARLPAGEAVFAQFREHYEALQSLLALRRAPTDVAWSLRLAESTRARALHDACRQQRAADRGGGEERRARRRLATVARRRTAARADPGTPRYLLADLERQERELEDALRDLSMTADSDAAPGVLTASEIQGALPVGALLLEFAVVEEAVQVWAVTRDSLELFVLSTDVATLTDLVLAAVAPCYAAEVADEGADAWLALSAAVLEAVGPLVDAADTLIVSADGPLHYTPFEPMVDGPTIVYVPSASVGLGGSSARRETRDYEVDFVGFGNPAFDRSFSEFAGLPPLPGAEFEVREIAALFGDRGVALCGAAAVEPDLRSWARRCRYLHVATHGIPDLDNPLRSGLVLASPPGTQAAGAEFDDVLYGYEMVDLRIEAELVVCASCYTGFGTIQAGGGMASLGSALLMGGARWVLVTLWAVGDRLTALFMFTLYRALRAGASVPAAVNVARAEVRRRDPRPRAWAPFVLFGADHE